jgi:hypothetical protein
MTKTTTTLRLDLKVLKVREAIETKLDKDGNPEEVVVHTTTLRSRQGTQVVLKRADTPFPWSAAEAVAVVFKGSQSRLDDHGTTN